MISPADRLRTSFCVPVWQKEQVSVQTRSLEYIVRHILSTDQIGKSQYRQCEQVQSAIEDIQQGMRDSIVLNNLSVELAKL